MLYNKIFIKYIFIIAAQFVLAIFFAAILDIIWPTTSTIEIDKIIFSISTNIYYVFINLIINIFVVILIAKDLGKIKIKSVPILVLTIFSSFVGIIFFYIVFSFHYITEKV